MAGGVKQAPTNTNQAKGFSAASTPSNNSAAARINARNQKNLEKLADKKFEDNILAELEFKRFTEAKQRLRDFITSSDMSDLDERKRLLSYFSHRYQTLIQILKEAVRSKRLQKNNQANLTVKPQRNTQITREFKLGGNDY